MGGLLCFDRQIDRRHPEASNRSRRRLCDGHTCRGLAQSGCRRSRDRRLGLGDRAGPRRTEGPISPSVRSRMNSTGTMTSSRASRSSSIFLLSWRTRRLPTFVVIPMLSCSRQRPTTLTRRHTSMSRLAAYWAQLFFRHGFLRDVDYDASFLTPHAVLFRRRAVDIEELVGEYERAVANVTTILGTRARDAVAEHDRLAARFNALASDHDVLASEQNQKQGELDSLRASLTDLERRRTAEVLAAHDAMQAYERGQQRLSHLVEVRDAELAAIRQTKTFRYTTSLRRLYGRLRRPSAGGEVAPNAAPVGARGVIRSVGRALRHAG